MTAATIYFLTTYELDGITILTPPVGAPHSESFKMASAQGQSGWAPYLDANTIDQRAGKLNGQSGRTDVGELTLAVLDRRLELGDNAERWVTAFGRLVGLPFKLERSFDGGTTKRAVFSGRWNRQALNDRVTFQLTGRDLSGDFVNTEVFVGTPHQSATGASRPWLLPIGPKVAYGSVPAPALLTGTIKAYGVTGIVRIELTDDAFGIDANLNYVAALLNKLSARSQGPYYDPSGSGFYVPAKNSAPEYLRVYINDVTDPATGYLRMVGIEFNKDYRFKGALPGSSNEIVGGKRCTAILATQLTNENGDPLSSNPAYLDPADLDVDDAVTVGIVPHKEPLSVQAPILLTGTTWPQLMQDLLDGYFGYLDDATGEPVRTFRHREPGPDVALSVALAGAGAGNVENGDHDYAFTWVTADGETTASPLDDVTVADKTTNGKVAVTRGAAVPSELVTHWKLYRTVAAGAQLKLLATIAVATTTYLDNTADAGLGANVPTVNTATPFTALIADPRAPVVRDIVQAKMRLFEYLEKGCQAHGYGWRVSALNRIEAFLADLTVDEVSDLPQVTDDDVLVVPQPQWEEDLKDEITRVEVDHYVDVPMELRDIVFPGGGTEATMLAEIPGALIMPSVEPVIAIIGDPEVSDRQLTIEDRWTRSTPDETIENINGIEWSRRRVTRRIDQLRGPFSRGTAIAALYCKRTAVIAELFQGDWFGCTVAELPDPDNGQLRGGTRIMRVLERTDKGPFILIRAQDSGLDVETDVPTGGTPAQETGNEYHGVEWPTIALNADDDPVVVEYAVTSQAVMTHPDEDDPAWTRGVRMVEDGTAMLQPLPSGKRIWPRMRSVPDWNRHAALPSVWVYGAYVDTDTLPSPTSWDNDTIGATTLIAGFGVPAGMEAYRLESLLDDERYALLAPGATQALYSGLETGTSYKTSGRYIDPYGGVGTADDDTDSTSAAPSLSPPTNLNLVGWYPRAVSGMLALEYELWVQAEEGTPYIVEFAMARETATGSGVYGAYTTVAYADSEVGTWTKTQPASPTFAEPTGLFLLLPDELLARFKCRYVIAIEDPVTHAVTGYDPVSVYGTVIDVDPTTPEGEPATPAEWLGVGSGTDGPAFFSSGTLTSEVATALERGGTESDLSATGPGLVMQATSGAALSVGFNLPAGTYEYAIDSVLRPASDNNAGNTLGDASHTWYAGYIQRLIAGTEVVAGTDPGGSYPLRTSRATLGDAVSASSGFLNITQGASNHEGIYIDITAAQSANRPGILIRDESPSNAATLQLQRYADAITFRFGRSNGTIALPSQVLSGESLVELTAQAQNATTLNNVAQLRAAATETQSGGNRGAKWQFRSNPVGSSTMTTIAEAEAAVGLTLQSGGHYLGSADNAIDVFTTGARARAMYGYTGNFATLVTAGYYVGAVSTPAQWTANTDNFSLGSFATLRVSSDASRNLTGITGGAAGRRLTLMNIGSQNIVIVNDATSTAANRFLTGTGADITMAALDVVQLEYDGTSARWRVVSHY